MAGYSSDRYLFQDPFNRSSINRTTRFREKKRRLVGSASVQNDFVDPVEYEEGGIEAIYPDDIDASESIDPEEDIDECNDPQENDANGSMESPEDSEAELSDSDELMQPTTVNVAKKPLYDSSSLTSLASNVLIMEFKMCHNLSNEGLKDLLQLIHLHCPNPNECITSPYTFKKMFLTSSALFHYYCSMCSQAVCSGDVICPNEMCKADLSVRGNLSYFMEEPISPQLRNIFRRKYPVLRGQMRKFSTSTMCSDICYGALYKELCVVVPHDHLVTLTLNTDGIPIFKSSNFSFWPVYLFINELPYKMRVCKENRIFAGLWHGLKPNMSLFLKPLAKFLQAAFEDGIEVFIEDYGKIGVKVLLLATTCDLPARAAVLNFTQFNGFYGCCRCKQKGKSVKCESGGTVRVYPYDESDPTGPKRTHEETLEHAKKAVESGSAFCGVKGLSWLGTAPHFNLIRGTSVDYMHCVLLGVSRRLMKMWFSSKLHDKEWYIGTKVALIDKLLLAIKPPSEMQRTPRSLVNTRQYWKAHELRAWLLHYSPIALRGILPDIYYQHYLLLVEGVYLLLKDEVDKDDINQSSRLFNHYCFMFAPLYGERNMSANIHILLHLPEAVEDLGPLWAHSCFPFETANGELLKLFHGSQSVDKQVADNVKMLSVLPEVAETALDHDSKEYDFFMKMRTKGRHSGKAHLTLSDNYVLIGHPKCAALQLFETQLLEQAGINISAEEQFMVYPHLLLVDKDRTVTTKSASRSLKRNNSCVKYSILDTIHHGVLQKNLLSTVTQQCYAIINQLQPASLLLCQDPITKAKLNEHIASFYPPRSCNMHVVFVNSIMDKCVLMEVQDEVGVLFVSTFPNTTEVE